MEAQMGGKSDTLLNLFLDKKIKVKERVRHRPIWDAVIKQNIKSMRKKIQVKDLSRYRYYKHLQNDVNFCTRKVIWLRRQLSKRLPENVTKKDIQASFRLLYYYYYYYHYYYNNYYYDDYYYFDYSTIAGVIYH